VPHLRRQGGGDPAVTGRANFCRAHGAPEKAHALMVGGEFKIEERSFVAEGAPLDDGQKELGMFGVCGCRTRLRVERIKAKIYHRGHSEKG
jgi:hypothetical protein